jgi:hypothetical protein
LFFFISRSTLLFLIITFRFNTVSRLLFSITFFVVRHTILLTGFLGLCNDGVTVEVHVDITDERFDCFEVLSEIVSNQGFGRWFAHH